MICPANTERELLFGLYKQIDGLIERTLPVKPVMIKTEPIQIVLSGNFDLLHYCFRNSQVVKSKISRELRLVVAFIFRFTFCDVGPFRKSFSPPPVIFWSGIRLRQIKGNWFHLNK